MTAEEARNLDTIRAQHEHLSAGRLDAALAQWADPALNHGRPAPHPVMRAILADILTTFPDLDFAVEDLVASGASVVARCRFAGTHRGTGRLPINGGLMMGVAPTGRAMTVQHMHWYVLRDGRIAEHWANRDDVGMMQQLGLMPPPVDFDFASLVGAPPPRTP